MCLQEQPEIQGNYGKLGKRCMTALAWQYVHTLAAAACALPPCPEGRRNSTGCQQHPSSHEPHFKQAGLRNASCSPHSHTHRMPAHICCKLLEAYVCQQHVAHQASVQNKRKPQPASPEALRSKQGCAAPDAAATPPHTVSTHSRCGTFKTYVSWQHVAHEASRCITSKSHNQQTQPHFKASRVTQRQLQLPLPHPPYPHTVAAEFGGHAYNNM
jgi:hypothetical protein